MAQDRCDGGTLSRWLLRIAISATVNSDREVRVGSVIKWQKMGERAAELGEVETACPYAVGGVAFQHWMTGYRRIAALIEDHLRDMASVEDLRKSTER
jgi:hypothetical protein